MEPQRLQLPPLRQDLQIKEGKSNEQGEPVWLIYDPLRNRYFQVSLPTIQLLGLWQPHLSTEQLLEQASTRDIDVTEEELLQLVDFFTRSHLTEASAEAAIERLEQDFNKGQKQWFSWLIHNYLFIRIPLWKPDYFLSSTLEHLQPLFNRKLHRAIQLLGLAGVLIVLQQWEAFTHTFDHFFSWQGLGLYAVTLMVIKSLHELAHAYTSKQLQCRVPSMGVAFLVLFPVLYTDTTDAWKLNNHKDRLRIVFAGVKMELHLALLATFLWGILPEGPFKTAAFFVASTSWITSAMINLNPFMRFDGYFALSDWLQAPNLQPRAFALGRWKLRELLFGFNHSRPEQISSHRTSLFIGYAWFTWLYRFFLFLGIALLVYHFTFKVLGILLFAVEIIWFILLPIYSEMKIWWHHKGMMRLNRQTLRTLALTLSLLLLGVIPWKNSIQVPAVLVATELESVYAPEDATVKRLEISPGDLVTPQQTIITLESAPLNSELRRKQIEYDDVLKRLNRQLTTTEDHITLQQELKHFKVELQTIQARIERLTLHPSRSGVVTNQLPIQRQQTVSKDQLLTTIRPLQGSRVVGFITQGDLSRIHIGAKARWVSNNQPTPPLSLTLQQIATSSTARLPFAELGSTQKGIIPVYENRQGEPTPESSIYQLTFSTAIEMPSPQWRESGVVLIEGARESFLQWLWRVLAGALIEESVF